MHPRLPLLYLLVTLYGIVFYQLYNNSLSLSTFRQKLETYPLGYVSLTNAIRRCWGVFFCYFGTICKQCCQK